MKKGILEINETAYGLEIVYFNTEENVYMPYYPCDEDADIIRGILNENPDRQIAFGKVEEIMREWNYSI